MKTETKIPGIPQGNIYIDTFYILYGLALISSICHTVFYT